MRTAVFVVLVAAGAQTARSAPPVPVMPPPVPPGPVAGPAAVDPEIEKHLAAWCKKSAEIGNLRATASLTRRNAAFKSDTTYKGALLALKPSHIVLRLDNAADPTKADYEAYISDGKTLYVYSGNQKTITEIPLLAKWPFDVLNVAKQPALVALLEVTPKNAAERFEVSLFRRDGLYTYLEFKPRTAADRAEFESMRVALYPPNSPHAYIPAQVALLRPNGDLETWSFADIQTDLASVTPANFKFVPIPGWKHEKPFAKP